MGGVARAGGREAADGGGGATAQAVAKGGGQGPPKCGRGGRYKPGFGDASWLLAGASEQSMRVMKKRVGGWLRSVGVVGSLEAVDMVFCIMQLRRHPPSGEAADRLCDWLVTSKPLKERSPLSSLVPS